MVSHEYKRDLSFVNCLTTFLVVAIAAGFIGATQTSYEISEWSDTDVKWIMIVQNILLTTIILISFAKALWLFATKPFGDKFFQVVYYSDLCIAGTYLASILGNAATLALNYYHVIHCDPPYTIVQGTATIIKVLAVFFIFLEILIEKENKNGYENFMKQSKANCHQRLAELACLDDLYNNLSLEQFVKNGHAGMFCESNLWAQLERFLQGELHKVLSEQSSGSIRYKHTPFLTPRVQDFDYVYCPDLSKWTTGKNFSGNVPYIPRKSGDFMENLDNYSVSERSPLKRGSVEFKNSRGSGSLLFKELPSTELF